MSEEQGIIDQLIGIATQPNALRAVLILVLSLVAAYLLSNFVAKGIIRVAQFVSVKADNTPDSQRALRLRRVETYLSVTIAMVRVLFIAVVGYFAWLLLSPAAGTNTGIAAVGASAFFIVLAGATIGPLLRDITAGSTMIVERWFNVGDHIRVEPFWELGGVVERVTLRSTKLRSLNGEVVWLHNQHIQGVRVAPRGVRRLSVDVLVTDREKGLRLIHKAVDAVPVGNNLLAKKMKIDAPLQLNEQMWRITVTGFTPPGREWLMEQFFVDSLMGLDKSARGAKVVAYRPVARYSDPDADKNFKRAVRELKDSD